MSLHPNLVVFDLDFTLWDCGGTWCDCTTPPYNIRRQQIIDSTGRHIRFYDDVLAIFDHCDEQEIAMAVASRTEQPAWAKQLLDLLGSTHRFAFSEIYPSSKLRHFNALKRESQNEYADMLFFDDEMRNIHEVSGLGVTSIFVEQGITLDLFRSGLAEWQQNN